MNTENKIWFYGIAIVLIVFTTGFFYNYYNPPANSNKYEFPSPEKTARGYFEAWGNKRYTDMYSVISDEFKKTELTASSFASFKETIVKQEIEIVEIVEIKERNNDGKTASVSYSVLNMKKQLLNGSLMLEFREGDLIKGWKINNPYL